MIGECICCKEKFEKIGNTKYCEDCRETFRGVSQYPHIKRHLAERKKNNKFLLCDHCGIDLVLRIKSKEKGTWAVHHKDGNHSNNSPDNHELLCGECHASHHHNNDNFRELMRSENVRRKMRESHIGKPLPENTKQKMRESQKIAGERRRLGLPALGRTRERAKVQ